MIKLDFDLKRVNNDYYSKNDSNIFTIHEFADDGAAELTFIVPDVEQGIFLKLKYEHSQWLKYANNQKCVDGIVISISQDNIAAIHIVELKSGIGSKTWKRVQNQFRGSILRAVSFCGTIGVKIKSLCLYTAFVENKDKQIKEMQSNITSSFRRKTHVGRSQKNQYDWEMEEISLFEGESKFSHKIINMTNGGEKNFGSYEVMEDNIVVSLTN